uniref:ribosome-recycling factor-like n=1 Tax=Erigeron canadensis TaxID=72917 RepID=UPI001CB99DB6|nr:ribosome-recycling factor-like [Erigeron canadensis]
MGYYSTHIIKVSGDYVNKFVGEAKNELDKTTATIIHLANVGPTIRSDAISEMDAAIDALALNLSKLYNGRASRGMIDHLMVQVGNKGVKKELHTMASVSVLDPKTLTVTPHDTIGPNRDLKSLNRAIISSPLHFTTRFEGTHLIVTSAVCKEVSKFSKDAKEQIGSARKKALDSINEALSELSRVKHEANAVSAFSIEDARRLKEEIEDLTQKFTKSVEDICKVKNEESQGRSLLIAPVGFMGSLP